MEGRDGRTLLRTMSFISTRARALRQRFVPSQRSLSDTWQYNISDAFIDDDSNLPSPAMGGSMLSLLNETLRTCEEDVIETPIVQQNIFRAQRSRSLDSLGSANMPNTISPQNDNLTFQFPLEVASLEHQPLVPSPLGSAITPDNDFSIMGNKTEKHRCESMQHLSTTKQLPDEYISPSHNAEAILSPRYFDVTSIPKIPGPPPSPKKEGIARSAPRIFLPLQDCKEELISLKTKEMSTSTKSIENLKDNMIELNMENTNFQPTTSNLYLPLNIIESVNLISNEEKTQRYNSILKPNVLNVCPEENQRFKLPSINDTELNDLDLIDHEETRDKVHETAIPKRPTKLESRPRPKLKHQWSMDDTRLNAANYASALAMPTTFGNEVVQKTEIEKSADKRRRFFLRKQTNSAPDSFDGGPPLAAKVKEHHSVSFCLGSVRKCRGSDSSILPPTLPEIKLETDLGVEHLADLRYPDGDPPCHFCCQQTSTSIHDENRLKIMSGGLVRSRDGSRDDTGTQFMNLPSPNVQSEGEGDGVVFHRQDDDLDSIPPTMPFRLREDAEPEEEPPPASALTRRRALVPPKLIADCVDDERKMSDSSDCSSPRNRRSSIVVIPPMQICPGDLLVYSKVLTHRNNLLDGVNSRKGKNTWSLLKLFERTSRGKSGSLCGLEEVLGCLQRIEFDDEQLSRYRGMTWTEFISHVYDKNNSKARSGSGGTITGTSGDGRESSSSSGSSSPDPAPLPPPPVQSAPPPTKRNFRGKLQRAQSERCFERRLPGARTIFRGLDRTLPLRPSPLVSTLSEKDLLVSPGSTTSRIESKRREAVWDLFQSECAFLYDHLMVLKNVFMEPLKKIQVEGFAMFAEPELLFGNLDELCCVTYAFCKEFVNLLLQNVGMNGDLPTTEVLVKLFQKSSEADSVSQAYHSYALNYINALNYLETLRRHVEFCEFEKWCNRDVRCKKLQLTDLLVAPVQHIMKVPLILKEVETRTEEPTERELISQILEIEENSIRELDDKMKWLKNFERLLEIQRNIVWPTVLELDPKVYVPEFLKPALTRQPCDRIIVSPRRQIVIEGPLQVWDTGKPQEMYVVLFDDMLLITRRKKGLSKKKSSLSENWASSCSRGSGSSNEPPTMRYVVYKQPLSLDRFFIHEVSVPESASCRLENAFVLVSLNRFQQVITIHTFQAPTDQIKHTWLMKLRDTQDKWKRTLQHTVFRSPRLSMCSTGRSGSTVAPMASSCSQVPPRGSIT